LLLSLGKLWALLRRRWFLLVEVHVCLCHLLDDHLRLTLVVAS